MLAKHYERARQIVWLFYLTSAVMAYHFTYQLHQMAITASGLDFLWPVMWMQRRDLVQWVDIVSLGAVLSALWAAWKQDQRTARAAFAVFTLFCGGFTVSVGGINHLYHLWIWMAVVLVFLPNGRARADRLRYLLTISVAQALMLTFYTMAGFWKALYGLAAIWRGVEGNLSPRGLALQLADRIMQTNTQPLLGRFFVENYWLSWPMFVGMIYVQLVAVAIVFKPRLHVAWGLALIAFHIGTWLLMEITFPLHFMLLLVFLVLSPIRVDNWLQWQTVQDLPVFGRLFRGAPMLRPRLVPAE